MIALLAAMAFADPCGMVPPLYTGSGPAPIVERSGLQQTYVFFADGMETIAIRPGFTGSVEEFGMLVPLPSVPSLRKIDDRTFVQLEAAVDPPVVTVREEERYPEEEMLMPSAPADDGVAAKGMALRDTIKVVKEEAVGMYEVAVLEAGSAASLKRWMDEHSFQYPNGMDETVNDYVRERWMFVAIKARVSASSAVSARPGMRRAQPNLPAGSSFDGFVQGMAFRFHVDEPVVPMRLSVFNGDDTHNRVTMVSDRPVQIDDVSRALVRRQVRGSTLSDNLLEPLKLQYVGSKPPASSLSPGQVEAARNPDPYNGVARDLILSDLQALRDGKLELPFEEREKEWLRINEALMLRGPDIDLVVATAQKSASRETTAAAEKDLRNMTLTVIDGDLPTELLASSNLTFSTYDLPSSRNRTEVWGYQVRGPTLWWYR